jgi:hypothetical protein
MVSSGKIKNNFFWVPSAMMLVDSVLKFFHISLWVDFACLEGQNIMLWLGIIELCCLVVFLLPRTLTLGFFLLCCFWGVEIMVTLKSSGVNLFAVCMLAMFALAAYWRDSILFSKKYSNSLKQ